MKNTQITIWKGRNDIIETVDGILSYEDWCRQEVERLGRNRHYIVTKKMEDGTTGISIARREI